MLKHEGRRSCKNVQHIQQMLPDSLQCHSDTLMECDT